mgnify:CR=1 FL=1
MVCGAGAEVCGLDMETFLGLGWLHCYNLTRQDLATAYLHSKDTKENQKEGDRETVFCTGRIRSFLAQAKTAVNRICCFLCQLLIIELCMLSILL